MDVEEMLVEELFDDQANDESDDNEEREDEETEEATGEAQLELGGEGAGKDAGGEKPKKKIVRNPQPKLDADRILGPRGVPILEEVFSDFKPRGKGEEFRDLDKMMKRMEHWAHRLYPKLPFDDVMARISQLGKKKNVQVNLKKIRMGMPTFVTKPDSSDDEQNPVDNKDQNEAEVQRYEDGMPEDDDALFDQIMQEQGPPNLEVQSQSETTLNTTLSDEQRERMIRNRQLAEEKRRQKLIDKEKESDIQPNEATDDF